MGHRVGIHAGDVTLHADLHSLDHSAPADGPVILLHGLSQQGRFWDPVIGRMHTRPVLTLDQRGHGESDTPLTTDYSVAACADDVVVALDELGWDRAVVAGHSWGAFVAHHLAARYPDRVRALVLIDGGMWALSPAADRAALRERLRPPSIALPPDELWNLVRSGDLGPYWNPDIQSALSATFTTGADGLMRTRIGMERHMLVLDGLLAHDPAADVLAVTASGVPTWVVQCGDAASRPGFIDLVDDAEGIANYRVLRWRPAVHDVPLQWPALVAGLIDTAAQEGTW